MKYLWYAILIGLGFIPRIVLGLTITEHETEDLVTYNKIYVPEDYINQNWMYTYSGNDIVIITNQNCYTNYNTQYCNCYTYNIENNLISNVYSCSTNTNNTRIINNNYISDDIKYSNRILNIYLKDKIIWVAATGVGILLAILLTKRRTCL